MYPDSKQIISITKGDTAIRSIRRIIADDCTEYTLSPDDYILFTVKSLKNYDTIPGDILFQAKITSADYTAENELPFTIPADITNGWEAGNYCYDVKLFRLTDNGGTIENTIIKYSLLKITEAVTGRERV